MEDGGSSGYSLSVLCYLQTNCRIRSFSPSEAAMGTSECLREEWWKLLGHHM